MQIELDNAEVAYLQRVLSDALIELRNEVSNTDTPAYREELQADEDVLRRLILRFGGTLPNIGEARAS